MWAVLEEQRPTFALAGPRQRPVAHRLREGDRRPGRACDSPHPRAGLVGLELDPVLGERVVRLVTAGNAGEPAVHRADIAQVVCHDHQAAADLALADEVVLAGVEGDGATV